MLIFFLPDSIDFEKTLFDFSIIGMSRNRTSDLLIHLLSLCQKYCNQVFYTGRELAYTETRELTGSIAETNIFSLANSGCRHGTHGVQI